MELSKAKQIADSIVELLQTHCERINIAGSIRREKPEVKDIEIVYVPKKNQKDLIAIFQIVNAWPKVKGQPLGKYTQRIIPALIGEGETIALDLFQASRDNWGLQLAIRTGPAEYSHKMLAARWCGMKYQSRGGILYSLATGKAEPMREEKDLFDFLNIPFTEPRNRKLNPLI